MNKTNMNKPVMRLTLSGIMIALGTVLSLFTIIKMPQAIYLQIVFGLQLVQFYLIIY